jgi:hypothetical protein
MPSFAVFSCAVVVVDRKTVVTDSRALGLAFRVSTAIA